MSAVTVNLTPVPDGWSSAPIDASLTEQLRPIIARLNPAQRMWLSGYLAGLSDSHAYLQPVAPAPAPAPAATDAGITILYGSQSGNSESLAKRLGEALKQRGLAFTLLDMMDCRKNHLQDAKTLLVIVSTHGEGDPPDRAIPLHEFLHSRKAPQLNHLRYSVLALGDSSYEKFCETGKQFDARLAALGAQQLRPRVDCDVDFESPASQWINEIVEELAKSSGVAAQTVTAGAPRPSASLATAYTRKSPFPAPILTNQRLTARRSTKDVRHIELSLEGSNIRYEPGDAIGIVPHNREQDVDELLAALKFDAEAAVTVDSQPTSLRQALITHFDIGLLTKGQVERYASAVGADALKALLSEDKADELRRYLRGRHLIDLVTEHAPKGLDAESFAKLLRPMTPRLYSIASSQRATPDEAHLTVSIVEYEFQGRKRQGLVSGVLAELTSEDATVPVYLHRNPSFRLPTDPQTPIIMIGPGTGVAPFRSFLAEREAIGARGRNWLFFGDRTFESDFLYQVEWLQWRKSGLLTRIDVAFSRDQEEKIYVQHRLHEQGAEVWRWLQEGAHLYVCGDAEYMAPDVHNALLQIAQRHGGQSEEEASEYFLELQRERRYQRDVY